MATTDSGKKRRGAGKHRKVVESGRKQTENSTGADTSASRLGQNILWNYLSGFTSIFGLLLLYPLAVSIVGASSYGLWVLAIGAIQMLTMTDFGLGAGIVRTLTGIPDNVDYQRDRRMFVTAALLVFLILATVLTAVYTLIFPLYLQAVTIPEQDQAILWPMTILAGLTLFISLVGRGMNSVLWGLNRPDIERKAAVIAILGRAAGYAVVVVTDTGLLGIVVVECLSLMLPPLVCMVAVARRFSSPVFGPGLWRDHGKPLIKISSVMSIGALSQLGIYQLPLFLVGPTLGLHATTAFGALMRVYQSCRLVVSWIALPYGYPLRIATPDKAAQILKNCLTLTVGIGLLMGVALATIPTELMTAWMGDDFASAALGLSMLALGIMAEAITQPANLVMNLRGSAVRASILSLTTLVLTLPAVWLATFTDSITVVALATVLPSFLMSGVQMYLANKDVSYGLQRSDLTRWGGMAGGALLYAGFALLVAYFLPTWPTILVVGAGLAVMALRMLKLVRADGAVVAEMSEENSEALVAQRQAQNATEDNARSTTDQEARDAEEPGRA
ncbi:MULTISPECIES: lipopolysaccharide biosynthesis protein [Kocuria]|uniref:Lipopolysaccharide biosynthesis protein n=1 Tax=Kocuria subflava TaxID=1736139 RepID=A0A846TUF1_9MICC|nr:MULTISPECIES: lipopolysaccharide biosynthesis protein [Kocuria]NKE09412.1 lipopolysaccharide biosynthesis protein [Kocuria subflava]